MNKVLHIVKNNAKMLGYFAKFAPAYFWSNTLFCVWVAFVDMLSELVAVRFIFNSLAEGKGFGEIFVVVVLIGCAMFCRHIWGAVCEYQSAKANVRVKAGLRKIIFRQARRMDLEYYETPKFYNDFVWASSQSDTKIFEVFRSFSVLVARLSELLFIGGFMITTDYKLLIIVLISVALRMYFRKRIIKKKYEMDLEIKPMERRRDYITRVFYLADYAKEVRLSDMHKTLYERLGNTMSEIRSVYKKGAKELVAYAVGSSVAVDGLVDFLMYLYLCYQTIVTKLLMFGDLVSLINATSSMVWRMRQFIDVFSDFAKHSLYIDSFNNFMAYSPKIELSEGEHAPDGAVEIKLENVSFKYSGESEYSLKNINMTLHPYEKIAIVGYNGAGKSTLVKLLMRLYDATEGHIKMQNRDIKEYSINSYRQKFGSVFQDYKVFAGTVGENVVMDFAQEKQRDAIIKSLDESGFSDKLAELEEGIDTPVTREFSEKGVNFSGGEEQKIAISRVFYKNCDIVILDEPSSALDPVSEYNLNRTMLHLAEQKTVIFISHRLSTTCMADRIYMLEDGEIVEQGSHDELMLLGGKYAEMFNKQAEKYRM